MGKTVEIQPGDTLISIAHDEGIADWTKIWEHPRNEGLRQQRSNPQVLGKGDLLYVPGEDELAGETSSLGMDQAHTFKIKRHRCHFTMFAKDESGQPYAGNDYRLEVGDQVYEGATDDQGMITHPIDPATDEGRLTLKRNPEDPEEDYTWIVRIGHLDPVDHVTGVKRRLRNLGYQIGPIDDELDDVTKNSLCAFQQHMNLEVTGEPDAATQDALTSIHNDH